MSPTPSTSLQVVGAAPRRLGGRASAASEAFEESARGLGSAASPEGARR